MKNAKIILLILIGVILFCGYGCGGGGGGVDSEGNYETEDEQADESGKRCEIGDDTGLGLILTTKAEGSYVKTSDTEVDSSKTYYTESGGEYTAVASPTKSGLANYYELVGRGAPLNFLVVERSAVIRFDKHVSADLGVFARNAVGAKHVNHERSDNIPRYVRPGFHTAPLLYQP